MTDQADKFTALPYGWFLWHIRDADGCGCWSLWEKRAQIEQPEFYLCHIDYMGRIFEIPFAEEQPDKDERTDGRALLTPVSAEIAALLIFTARHLHTQEAWNREAERYYRVAADVASCPRHEENPDADL